MNDVRLRSRKRLSLYDGVFHTCSSFLHLELNTRSNCNRISSHFETAKCARVEDRLIVTFLYIELNGKQYAEYTCN